MSFVVAYALAGAGTLLVVLWVMLYLRYSSQYDVMIAAIDKKQFFLPEIFFIGFGFMDMFKVNLKTEAGRKKEKKIAEIYRREVRRVLPQLHRRQDRSPMR